MQPLDDMTFDNVITKLRMLHDSFRKVQSPNLVRIYDAIVLCHMIYYNWLFIFLYVIAVCHVITQFIKT